MAVSSPSSTQVHLTLPDDEFCCPLCIEIFEEPKLLSNCAHSFCKKCLQELVLHTSSSQVCCPVCRNISSVPENGVDGFVTNSLLVRLIDNIPGRKERNELVKALARCKDEMEKTRKIQDEIDKKLNTIAENREKGGNLKREISQHANDVIDSIRKCEQKLCKMVDESLERNGGSASFRENLVKHREKCRDHMDMASTYVENADGAVEKNDQDEISNMKKVLVDELGDELNSPFSSCQSLLDQVKDINMEFKKLEIKEDLLGQVEETVVVVSENEQPGVVHASGLEASGTQSTEAPSCRQSTANGTTPPITQIVSNVPLTFYPFQMTVCPNHGCVALLWREGLQVRLYDREGEHQSTIHIKYGDLWDVAFTNYFYHEVVVVNRANNRLLFYESDGQFIPNEVEPPRDCLRFTYVSIDDDCRVIVTSTTTGDDDYDEDEIISCIIVYDDDCEESSMMFGRRYLERPVSRAIFSRGIFYVADERQDQIYIMCFTHQGQACFSCSLGCNSINTCVSLSEDKFGQVVLSQSTPNGFFLNFIDDNYITTKAVNKKHNLSKGEVVTIESGSITLAEIYAGSKSMRIVKHSFQ